LPKGQSRLDAIPERLRRPLEAAVAGTLPPNVALMRLLIEAADDSEVRDALSAARRILADRPTRTARLEEVAHLLEGHPDAFAKVKAVLARVVHDASAGRPERAVAGFSIAFDRAVLAAPEASVALYALGSPELLRASTAEVIDALDRWGLIAPDKTLLEIGCGIGRFEEALAPKVRLAVGIDVSSAMLAEARRRCIVANASFIRTSGLDLGTFADNSFDLVLAVDSFPYLVQAGLELAARHIEESARVLKQGGNLVILNFSYGSDFDWDRRTLARLTKAKFHIERNGVQEFRLWDGAAFHFVRSV
jgi:2-polyprenyl-3-methyl-5-hydroxy-6-metoxy-1,4-benzoquinol methylase